MNPARRARTRALAAAVLAVALAGTGCAVFPRRPPAPPRPAPGYERLRDTLAAVDASGLAGRRIALDPGHGGFFRGALGVGGLSEAEVNLGVALRLRDLLAAHGAEVLLTRSSDRDFLTPADSTLRTDLAERARLAAAFDPDLFVSIHHNADARGAHDVNETQTYYKLGDEGPSLDAAQDVHRALVRNVGIRTNKVVPGNFYVLRTSVAPALLTECSYITNPDVEGRLRLPEKQELEAQALFVGLARYFARRVPVIEEFVACTVGSENGDRPDSVFGDQGEPTLVGRVRGPFDDAVLSVDGQPVPVLRVGNQLRSGIQILPPGEHLATLRARLAGTGAARERSCSFRVIRPPAAAVASAFPGAATEDVGVIGVRVRVEDGWSLPSQDSLVFQLSTQSRCLAPRETTVIARRGSAWAYFHPVRGEPWKGDATGRIELQVRCLGPATGLKMIPAIVQVWHSAAWKNERGALLQPVPVNSEMSVLPTVAAAAWERITPWPVGLPNRDGFVLFVSDSLGHASTPTVRGFRSWPIDSVRSAIPIHWIALCDGSLHGRRIVLDPEGGGEDAAGQGPGGTRAASLNLECARILAGFLAAAGADVRLTRDGDLALSDVERVQASEGFHAERFLRIAHRAAAPRLGSSPGSPAGRAWAERSAQALAALTGVAAPAVSEEAQYVMQQTSCPALFASPGSLADEGSEARLLAPGALRAEAYALFVALAREWAPGAAWPADSLTVRDPAGRPVPDAAVTLGDALVLVTDASGLIRFARTEPGPIAVAVEDTRARFRGVLLDSQRGAVLTGTPGR